MSIVTDICDAVVAELNGHAFTPSFTALRKALPEYDLEKLQGLRVTVLPRGLEIEAETRSESRYEAAIDIGVQGKIEIDEDAEVASLGELVDAVIEFLHARPLAGAPWAEWVATANEPVYAADHLKQYRVFTSIVTVRYQMMKQH